MKKVQPVCEGRAVQEFQEDESQAVQEDQEAVQEVPADQAVPTVQAVPAVQAVQEEEKKKEDREEDAKEENHRTVEEKKGHLKEENDSEREELTKKTAKIATLPGIKPTPQLNDLKEENSVRFKIRAFTQKFNIPPTNKLKTNRQPPPSNFITSDAALSHLGEKRRPGENFITGDRTSADRRGKSKQENLQQDSGLVGNRGRDE